MINKVNLKLRWPGFLLGALLQWIFVLSNTYSVELGKKVNLFTIDKIKVSGLRKIEPEAIMERIEAAPGKRLNNYMLHSDLSKIYQMKYFESVEAHSEKEGSRNVLHFKIKEKPIVKKIRIKGNSEVGDDDLKDQIKTKEFSIVDINTIKADVQALQKVYEEKGYYLAQVKYEVAQVDKENVEVDYIISEFEKVQVKKVTFLGNEALSDDELKSFMITREESLFSGLSEASSFKEFNFQADIERLAYLYRTKGYLQVNIGNPVVTVSEDKKWIFITINVTEGPQFSVNSIEFSGDLIFTDDQLREGILLKEDDIYSEEKLRKDIQMLTEKYQDEGYAFVNVLRTLDPVPGENKVDVRFSFEKGKIAYFGNIIIKGNTKTRDKVIRRELKVYEGMRYSGSKLRISRENVTRLGFFERDTVVFNTVTPRGKDDVLDVEITVKERMTGQISLGAGYSTQTKGFINASIKQNNFRGLGQTLDFSLRLADTNQSYTLGFTEPYFLDTKWTLGGQYSKERDSTISEVNQEREAITTRVGYPIFDYARFFVTHRLEDLTIRQASNPTIVKSEVNGLYSSLGLQLVYDRRNNIFETSKGYYISTGVEYTGVGGDKRFWESHLEGRYFRPIVGELVLRSRVRVEQLFEQGDNIIPRTKKRGLGGARSLRGYRVNNVGPYVWDKPVNADGTDQDEPDQRYATGGLQSLYGQFELEHPLVKEAGLKWVVFYDVGNVYEKYIGADENSGLLQSYGFGFRWFSPIGVLRFELGFPINPREVDKSSEFFFDIGQIF